MSNYIELDHPGVMLKEDFLDDLGIKPGALAKAIGVDRTAIKKIIDGNRSITADMSIKLGLFFGMSPQFWLNMQRDYDFRIAQRENFEAFSAIVQPFQTA